MVNDGIKAAKFIKTNKYEAFLIKKYQFKRHKFS